MNKIYGIFKFKGDENISDFYIAKGEDILKKLNIKVRDISSKSEIEKSKDFNATLKPTLKKIIIK